MNKETSTQTPACPICNRNDQVDLVRSVSEKEDENTLYLAPPEAPGASSPLFSVNEGLGCLGALFFGAAFFLSVAYGSTTGSIIFGIFILFFGISFAITIWRGFKTRQALQRELPAWQEKMEVWERLLFCSRDKTIFDPETKRSVEIDQMKELLENKP